MFQFALLAMAFYPQSCQLNIILFGSKYSLKTTDILFIEFMYVSVCPVSYGASASKLSIQYHIIWKYIHRAVSFTTEELQI